MKIWCKVLTVLLCVIILSSPALSIYADTIKEQVDSVSGTTEFRLSGKRGSAQNEHINFNIPDNYTGFLSVDYRGYLSGNQYYTTRYYWNRNVNGHIITFSDTKSFYFDDSYVIFTYPINPYKGDYSVPTFSYLNFRNTSLSDIEFQISTNGNDWDSYSKGFVNSVSTTNLPSYEVDFHYTSGDAYDYDINVTSISSVVKVRDLPSSTRYIRFVCKFRMFYPISHYWLDDIEDNYHYNTLYIPYKNDGMVYYREYEEAVTQNITNISNNISDVNSNLATLSNNITSGHSAIISSIEQSTSEQTGTITDALIDMTESINSNNDNNTQVIIQNITSLPRDQEEYFEEEISEVEEFTAEYENERDELKDEADSAVDALDTAEPPDEFDEFIEDDAWTIFGQIPFNIELVGLFISTLVGISIISYIITGKNR